LRKTWFALATFAALLSLDLGSMASAAYPDRTVKFIVGFEPGGGTDTLARIVAQKLTAKWGQPVVVENRAGADGSIAADAVARLPADGYNILWASSSHPIAPYIHKVNFDPLKSFTPITEAAGVPVVLLVNPSLKVDTLKDFIQVAKSRPGDLTFGSSGAGTVPHLAMALLMKLTGTKIVGVSYKGTAPAVVGLLGGETQVMFGAVPTALAQVQAGKLKALAVSSDKRVPAMADIPTVAEAGVPGFEASGWYGVLGPAGLPADVVTKLHDDIVEALNQPDVQEMMAKQGFVPVGDSPDHFASKISAEMTKWSAFLAPAGK
jgi:tripartite-type tricarboxylate transporter receptor subunit TctC